MRAGEEHELNVNGVVRGAEALLRHVAHAAGVKLETNLDSSLPPARGRGGRLQQVFLIQVGIHLQNSLTLFHNFLQKEKVNDIVVKKTNYNKFAWLLDSLPVKPVEIDGYMIWSQF